MNRKLLLSIISLGFYLTVSASGNTNKEPGIDARKDELCGTVIHAETKKPLEGVTVTAMLISKKEKSAATNEDGQFSFDELKPGTYRFVFEKYGFKKIVKERIIIRTDETFQLKIEMAEAGEYDIMPSPFNVGGF